MTESPWKPYFHEIVYHMHETVKPNKEKRRVLRGKKPADIKTILSAFHPIVSPLFPLFSHL